MLSEACVVCSPRHVCMTKRGCTSSSSVPSFIEQQGSMFHVAHVSLHDLILSHLVPHSGVSDLACSKPLPDIIRAFLIPGSRSPTHQHPTYQSSCERRCTQLSSSPQSYLSSPTSPPRLPPSSTQPPTNSSPRKRRRRYQINSPSVP